MASMTRSMRRIWVPVSVKMSVLVGAYAVTLPAADLKRPSRVATSSADTFETRCIRVMKRSAEGVGEPPVYRGIGWFSMFVVSAIFR